MYKNRAYINYLSSEDESLPAECRRHVCRLSPSDESNCYPMLQIHKTWERVVLFTAPRTGVVVSEGRGKRPVGYWTNGWDESMYKPFSGNVLISNLISE